MNQTEVSYLLVLSVMGLLAVFIIRRVAFSFEVNVGLEVFIMFRLYGYLFGDFVPGYLTVIGKRISRFMLSR